MSETTLDKYERKLQEKLDALQECQKNRGFQSCFACKDLLLCKIRQEYVQAVYQSMSKGEGGGFEF